MKWPVSLEELNEAQLLELLRAFDKTPLEKRRMLLAFPGIPLDLLVIKFHQVWTASGEHSREKWLPLMDSLFANPQWALWLTELPAGIQELAKHILCARAAWSILNNDFIYVTKGADMDFAMMKAIFRAADAHKNWEIREIYDRYCEEVDFKKAKTLGNRFSSQERSKQLHIILGNLTEDLLLVDTIAFLVRLQKDGGGRIAIPLADFIG